MEVMGRGGGDGWDAIIRDAEIRRCRPRRYLSGKDACPGCRCGGDLATRRAPDPVDFMHPARVGVARPCERCAILRRFDEVPPLTTEQCEALDLFDALANDPEINLQMEFQPGDMQWVHNHTLLHDRTAYEDWAEPEKKRHLLRLWLAVPDARPLPEIYAERYGQVTVGDRGGIIVPGARLNAPMEAE